MQKNLILRQFEDFRNSSFLLKSSIDNYVFFDPERVYSPKELEFYDSLAFRFEKTLELSLHFFRGLEVFLEATTSETLRDRLFKMQKLEIIDDVDFWLEARQLRNRIAHTYMAESLKDLYQEIFNRSKTIFFCLDKVEQKKFF